MGIYLLILNISIHFIRPALFEGRRQQTKGVIMVGPQETVRFLAERIRKLETSMRTARRRRFRWARMG